MIRMLGVLAGSALAVAALLLFVGIPRFANDAAYTDTAENKVITLPLRAAARPGPSPDPAVESVVEPESVAENDDEVVDVRDTAEASTAFIDLPGTLPETGEVSPEAPAVDRQSWYAFWSPFRSETAADGFVTQLQRVTGLDYRVVRIKPGVYEVAFAYADDAEIATSLTRISAATGLDLPED